MGELISKFAKRIDGNATKGSLSLTIMAERVGSRRGWECESVEERRRGKLKREDEEREEEEEEEGEDEEVSI